MKVGKENINGFLATSRLKSIFEEIKNDIASYASTARGKERILKMEADIDNHAIEQEIKKTMASLEEIKKADTATLKELLSRLREPQQVRPERASYYILLTTDDETFRYLENAGILRWAQVESPETLTSAKEDAATILVRGHKGSDLDSGLTGKLYYEMIVDYDCRVEELAPEMILSFFRKNINILETISQFGSLLGRELHSASALRILKNLELSLNMYSSAAAGNSGSQNGLDDTHNNAGSENKAGSDAPPVACTGAGNPYDEKVWLAELKKEADTLNKEVEAEVAKIALAGEHLVEILKKGTAKPLEDAKRSLFLIKKERFEKKWGSKSFCLTDSFPYEVDYESFENVASRRRKEFNLRRYRLSAAAAVELAKMRQEIEREIEWVFEIDYLNALYSFISTKHLKPPVIVSSYSSNSFEDANKIPSGFFFTSGLDLRIAGDTAQRISYSLGLSPDLLKTDICTKLPENAEISPSAVVSNTGKIRENENGIKRKKKSTPESVALTAKVAFLTGANSGGKTTLLDTIAQMFILAKMGLPVNAEHAVLSMPSKMYYFSWKKSLGAGSFEQFISEIIKLLDSKEPLLILADELEAVTEPGAATAIMEYFASRLVESSSSAVIVTHLASRMSIPAGVRVDGIEAKGLDDNFNLIVDRQPKYNYYASSTPELIIMKLIAKAKGSRKEILEGMLEAIKRKRKENSGFLERDVKGKPF